MIIAIAGDICPINRNETAFFEGDDVFSDVRSVFQEADLLLANLECPLILRPTPIKKTGPALAVSGSSIRAFAQAGFRALGLANNHIMDHGAEGLKNTMEVCRQYGIATFGAGLNLLEARKALVLEVEGFKVGLVGMAEHEWSIARLDLPGANPIDPIAFIQSNRKLRNQIDCLIVLLHAGSEGYPYPSPRLQDLCRFLIEEGASAVICQHSHCIGSYETYQQGHIVYGQGNFVFDYPGQGMEGREGLLVLLDIQHDRPPGISFVPVVQLPDKMGVRLADAGQRERILSGFQARSADISTAGFIKERWMSFCATKTIPYMNALLGYNRILTRLNRNGLLLHRLYNGNTLRQQMNGIQCESHREVLLTVLSQLICQYDQRREGKERDIC